jgi:hypothetical protein
MKKLEGKDDITYLVYSFKRNKVDTFISSQPANPRTLNRKGANQKLSTTAMFKETVITNLISLCTTCINEIGALFH